MKNKLIKLSFTLLSFFSMTLTSCAQTVYLTKDDPGTATIRIFKDNDSTSTQRFISPKNVKIKYTYDSLSGLLSNNENVCPSTGNVNLLVVPVHIPGQEVYRTDEIKKDIEKIFFGENEEQNGYKSVKEYYYESSYGKLNFNGKVTDWFDVSEHTSITSSSQISSGTDGTIINEILPAAVEWAKTSQNINLKDYDKNKDGAIDAVWLVYNHLDWSTDLDLKLKENPNYNGNDINSAFWNFTSWDWFTPNAQSGKDPTTSGFSWASFSMMYTGYCNRDENGVADLNDLNSIKLDSHTFIHETGHLLGLDDYYASDDNSYHPAGSSTMMDQNIGDLDSYSKMLLGWITPYIVYGTSEILIPTVTSSDRAVIVIPSNFKDISDSVELAIENNSIKKFTYEFNPFSEYIMIDLYSPDGLNKQDTFGPYIYDRDTCIAKTGVRIYHIDSRIFKCNVINYEGGQSLSYVKNYVWDEKSIGENQVILMPISNQKIEQSNFQLPYQYNFFDQIRLLEATGFNSFNYGLYADQTTLWNTESDAFDIIKFGNQFFNANYSFNDGKELPFKIKVLTLKEIA